MEILHHSPQYCWPPNPYICAPHACSMPPNELKTKTTKQPHLTPPTLGCVLWSCGDCSLFCHWFYITLARAAAQGCVWGSDPTSVKVCVDVHGYWYHWRQYWCQSSWLSPVAMLVFEGLTTTMVVRPTQVACAGTKSWVHADAMSCVWFCGSTVVRV